MTPEHKAKMAAGRARAKAEASKEDPRIVELSRKLDAALAEVARLNRELSAKEVMPPTVEPESPAPVPVVEPEAGARVGHDRPLHAKVPGKTETRGKDAVKLETETIFEGTVEELGAVVNFSGLVEGEWPPQGEVEAIIEGFVPNPKLVGVRVMGRRCSMWKGPRNWRGQEKIMVRVDPAHAGAGNPIFLPV